MSSTTLVTLPTTQAADYVSAADGGDSVDLATPVNALRALDGKQSVFVSARLSIGAATVDVTMILYDADGNLIGVETQTATAGLYRETVAGLFLAPTLPPFNTKGGGSYEVRVADPSTGTVDLVVWHG